MNHTTVPNSDAVDREAVQNYSRKRKRLADVGHDPQREPELSREVKRAKGVDGVIPTHVVAAGQYTPNSAVVEAAPARSINSAVPFQDSFQFKPPFPLQSSDTEMISNPDTSQSNTAVDGNHVHRLFRRLPTFVRLAENNEHAIGGVTSEDGGSEGRMPVVQEFGGEPINNRQVHVRALDYDTEGLVVDVEGQVSSQHAPNEDCNGTVAKAELSRPRDDDLVAYDQERALLECQRQPSDETSLMTGEDTTSFGKAALAEPSDEALIMEDEDEVSLKDHALAEHNDQSSLLKEVEEGDEISIEEEQSGESVDPDESCLRDENGRMTFEDGSPTELHRETSAVSDANALHPEEASIDTADDANIIDEAQDAPLEFEHRLLQQEGADLFSSPSDAEFRMLGLQSGDPQYSSNIGDGPYRPVDSVAVQAVEEEDEEGPPKVDDRSDTLNIDGPRSHFRDYLSGPSAHEADTDYVPVQIVTPGFIPPVVDFNSGFSPAISTQTAKTFHAPVYPATPSEPHIIPSPDLSSLPPVDYEQFGYPLNDEQGEETMWEESQEHEEFRDEDIWEEDAEFQPTDTLYPSAGDSAFDSQHSPTYNQHDHEGPFYDDVHAQSQEECQATKEHPGAEEQEMEQLSGVEEQDIMEVPDAEEQKIEQLSGVEAQVMIDAEERDVDELVNGLENEGEWGEAADSQAYLRQAGTHFFHARVSHDSTAQRPDLPSSLPHYIPEGASAVDSSHFPPYNHYGTPLRAYLPVQNREYNPDMDEHSDVAEQEMHNLQGGEEYQDREELGTNSNFQEDFRQTDAPYDVPTSPYDSITQSYGLPSFPSYDLPTGGFTVDSQFSPSSDQPDTALYDDAPVQNGEEGTQADELPDMAKQDILELEDREDWGADFQGDSRQADSSHSVPTMSYASTVQLHDLSLSPSYDMSAGTHAVDSQFLPTLDSYHPNFHRHLATPPIAHAEAEHLASSPRVWHQIGLGDMDSLSQDVQDSFGTSASIWGGSRNSPVATQETDDAGVGGNQMQQEEEPDVVPMVVEDGSVPTADFSADAYSRYASREPGRSLDEEQGVGETGPQSTTSQRSFDWSNKSQADVCHEPDIGGWGPAKAEQATDEDFPMADHAFAPTAPHQNDGGPENVEAEFNDDEPHQSPDGFVPNAQPFDTRASCGPNDKRSSTPAPGREDYSDIKNDPNVGDAWAWTEANRLIQDEVSPDKKEHYSRLLAKSNNPKTILYGIIAYLGAAQALDADTTRRESSKQDHQNAGISDNTDSDDGSTLRPGKSKARQGSRSPTPRPLKQINLAASVRKAVANLLGLDSDRKKLEPRCIRAWQLDEWKAAKLPGPTIENFRLDLESKGTRTEWNAAAAGVFVPHFRSLPGNNIYPVESVENAFHTHLIQLHRNLEAEKKGKTSKKLTSEQFNRRKARRKRLLQRHVRTIQGLIADYPEETKHLKAVEENLTWDMVSGDETDAHSPRDNRRYWVNDIPYRSIELKDLLHSLIALDIAKRYIGENNYGRGRMPVIRIHRPNSHETEHGDPPKDCPRNFYSTAWFEGHPNRADSVDATDPIDLTLPRHLHRKAARFLHVKELTDKPLAANPDDSD